jgi:hypothetical protein
MYNTKLHLYQHNRTHWMAVCLGEDKAMLESMVEEIRSQVPEEIVATNVG